MALPCATQNEGSGEEASKLVENGVKFVAEGSNMGCSQDAIDVFEKTRSEKKMEATWYAPGTSCFSFVLSDSPVESTAC